MIKNYLLIAWRNLLKQRVYSFIKICGFALSIAAFLLIALFIRDELSFDKSWPDADRIYRVTGEFNNKGKMERGVDWPAPMAKVLKEEFPEVEKAGRLMDAPLFYGAGSNQVRPEGALQNSFENGFTYFDQELLDILQLPLLYGDRRSALGEPNTVVISKSKAGKYFPGENPVGKLLVLNNDVKNPYKVGGVMEDFPKQSHLQYDFLLSTMGRELWPGEQTMWLASNYPIYVKLKKGADPLQFEKKLQSVLSRYFVPALREMGNQEADNVLKNARILIQPIRNVHLYSANIDDRLEKGDIRLVWLFGAIALFILVIACINFVNLSTAKSANRAKEVGLRKVIGSHRSSLVKQFLTESVLYSVLSFILGLFLAALLLPYFNSIASKSIHIPWNVWWVVPSLVVSAFFIGIIAGLYPAVYLSSFKPIDTLKGGLSRGSKNSVLRNGLVIFQFTTSIVLIISTLVIYSQTSYILNKKIGFDKDQVLLLQGTNTLENKIETFKNELLKSPLIKSVSISDYLPVSGTKRDMNTFFREGKIKEESGVGAQIWRVDPDYMKTLGMHLVAGREFSKDLRSDSAGIIINQAMARKMGLQNPVGQRVTNTWQNFTVIGVMEDFNFESMRQDVTPLCLALGKYNSSIVAVKINTADAGGVLSYLGGMWKRFSPDQPLRYTFLDESFANMYQDVKRTGRIFTSFAVLAIVIACLGLFALSAFMAEQRTKEIGIRKVLGATVNNIAAMLSKDFLRLILVSILLASPLAWWSMNKWLQDFAYRIEVGWSYFAVAGLLALVIALFTVCFQAIKAAIANPVQSLRTE